MKTILFDVRGLPHCPRNRSHIASIVYPKGGRPFATITRTEAAREYEKAIKHHLSSEQSKAEEFSKLFDKEKHHLTATWWLYSPDVKTQSGKYSETGTDLDAHKVLQDALMDFVGINDAYIVDDRRIKIQGDYRVSLRLEIRANDGEDLL